MLHVEHHRRMLIFHFLLQVQSLETHSEKQGHASALWRARSDTREIWWEERHALQADPPLRRLMGRFSFAAGVSRQACLTIIVLVWSLRPPPKLKYPKILSFCIVLRCAHTGFVAALLRPTWPCPLWVAGASGCFGLGGRARAKPSVWSSRMHLRHAAKPFETTAVLCKAPGFCSASELPKPGSTVLPQIVYSMDVHILTVGVSSIFFCWKTERFST